MATWTLYTSTVSGGDITQNHIVVLGNSLYYLDSSSGVSQYNKDTDSVQVVLDPATVGVTAAVNVACFNSTLYAGAYDSGGNATEVWRYDGTPNSWTRVLAKDSSALNSADMMCNDNYIVAIESEVVGGIWVSSDGSSWSAATTVPVSGYIDSLGIYPNYSSPLTLTFEADYAAGDVPIDDRTSQLISASTIEIIADYSVHRASVQNRDYLWFANFSTGDYEYSLDGSSFTVSPDGANIYPVISQNMPYSIGGDIASEVYYFIGGAWVSQGTLPAGNVDKAFRFSDEIVMVVGSDGNLYVSDEPVPDPATANARFYFAPAGQALAEKFTLPFPGVQPGGMTLDRTLGTVVIGSDAPSNEPVVYSTYPYTTGSATYDSFPTGAAIYSLKWI